MSFGALCKKLLTLEVGMSRWNGSSKLNITISHKRYLKIQMWSQDVDYSGMWIITSTLS